MMKCSIDNCEDRAVVRGWCDKHYRRWRAHGNPATTTPRLRGGCRVQDCASPHYSGGYCNAHYRRFRRYGDPLGGRAFEGDPARYVRDVVMRIRDTEVCFSWPYAQNATGYGVIVIDGRTMGAHRYICMEAHGEPPSTEHEAAHNCGNRICCNPHHLRWATVKENHADKKLHGTDQVGADNPRAKLTEADVLNIRTLAGQLSGAELATRYGVSAVMISNVIRRKNWTHI